MKLLEGLKAYWASTLQVALWLASLCTPFLYEPPAGLVERTHGSSASAGYHFALFVLTVLAGLTIVILRRGSLAQSTGFWFLLTVVALFAGGKAYFAYMTRLGQWTVAYNEQVFIKGDQIATPDLAALPTDERRLADAGGDLARVWSDRDVMLARWEECVLLYTTVIGSLALAVLSLVQTAGVALQREDQSAAEPG